ncbi:diguanylate cyclase with PAS/PAC sensor [Desulforamulus reducens MI-1]|uniref:Diguanylate cyclase with PAS/PAC sensor n=1 Tax=Desulforamulus reducens (strain ATCC BAA-1160 / DSM 100696 / MI-1) TaxID=349161 RepID=A4J1H8_DESRM|nr:PAS domain S-box protein [Desulforamulus reducens]ABO48931.1 diguanylate cyclase with PAS/PAC sensor [Desulforamulus reducens MI-1]
MEYYQKTPPRKIPIQTKDSLLKIISELEQRLQQITNNMLDLYTETDLAGIIRYVGPSHKTILGYDPKALKGTSVFSRIHPKDISKVTDAFQTALNSASEIIVEYQLQHATGHYLWVESVGRCLVEGDRRTGVVISTRNITKRKEFENALRESEFRFRQITENMRDIIIQIDKCGTLTYVGPSVKFLLGYQPERLLGKKVFELLHSEDYDKTTKLFANSLANYTEGEFECRCRHADGRYLWLECAGKILSNSHGQATGAIITARDITDRKMTKQALLASEERISRITENMLDIMVELNSEGITQYVSPSVKTVLGFDPKDLLGVPVFKNVHPEDLDRVLEAYEKSINHWSCMRVDFRYKNAQGYYRWLELIGNILQDEHGSVSTSILCLRDITERKWAELQTKYFSMHDPVTGLYNRTHFELEMRRLENSSEPVGLIVADLDGLKLINDTMGHEVGDNALRAVANILKISYREEDIVARIGGDELAVILTNVSMDTLKVAVSRLEKNIKDYNMENPGSHLSLSIGYALREPPTKPLNEVFKEADYYMYRAKLHHAKSTRSSLVQTLMKALEARDFITEGHGDRMKSLVVNIGKALGLPENKIYDLQLFAHFHDIGKVGISDKILFKPTKLTPDEHNEIKRHCEIGYRIAQASPELLPIADWILKHHEWWNGQGYPLGLKGEQIPLECRILAIADAYDAMTSDRPYRKAISHQEAIRELERNAGIQFDLFLLPMAVKVIEQSLAFSVD